MAKKYSNSGFVLVVIILLVVLAAIFLPLLGNLIFQESKSSTKSVVLSKALQVAEAGQEKGLWILSESKANWDMASTGTVIAGFNFDQVYSDVGGGKYKVRFASGPLANQVTIYSLGRHMVTGEDRAIKGVYSRPPYEHAAFHNSAWLVTSMPIIHWAPMRNTSNLVFTGAPPIRYPRKIAGAGIIPTDFDPTPPNTNNLDYWAFEPNMPDIPDIDLEYYMDKARNSQVPLTIGANGGIYKVATMTPAVAVPPGSGYFPLSANSEILIGRPNAGLPGTYSFVCSTCVIFFENDNGSSGAFSPYIQYSFLDVEALLSTYPRKFYLSGGIYNNFQATIPVNANLEYQEPTAQAVWTAGGAGSMANVWASPSRCCYSINNVLVHGFVYAGNGGIYTTNGAAIVGSIMSTYYIEAAPGDNLRVYFDPDVASKVQVKNPPRRLSWEEIKLSW